MDREPDRAAPVIAVPAAAPTIRVSGGDWPRWLPRLLGYFIAVGPAATDMYLPAFPAVEDDMPHRARHRATDPRRVVRRPRGGADHAGDTV